MTEVIPKMFSLEELALHEVAKMLWNILVLQYSEYISMRTEDLCNTSELREYEARVSGVISKLIPSAMPKLFKEKLVSAMINMRLGYSEAYDWLLRYRYLILTYQDLQLLAPLKDLDIDDEYAYERCCKYLFSSFSSSKGMHKGKTGYNSNPSFSSKRSMRKRKANIDSCPCFATNPYKSKYEVSHFLNPLGHFDDLSWSKLFVADENQSVPCRFYLACYYCFEEEIINLWHKMKVNNQKPQSEDDWPDIDEFGGLIGLWISYLEDEYEDEEDSFYVSGFFGAFDGYHEHAAKFFWMHCSDVERAEILSCISDNSEHFDMIGKAALNDRIGFVHFMYSLLPVEMKNNLMSYVISEKKGAWIWGSMLNSYYYKTVLNDILSFPYPVPLTFYKLLLEMSVPEELHSPIRVRKKVFEALWNNLHQDQRNEFLSSSEIMLRKLAFTNYFDVWEMVCLPLPRSMKENILFNDFTGLSRLRCFFLSEKNVELLRYLLLLLLDCDSENQKLSLRSDAAIVMDRFLSSEEFNESITLIKSITLMSVQRYITIIENFKGSLAHLEEQINQINKTDYATCSREFLLTKIYPLLSIRA